MRADLHYRNVTASMARAWRGSVFAPPGGGESAAISNARLIGTARTASKNVGVRKGDAIRQTVDAFALPATLDLAVSSLVLRDSSAPTATTRAAAQGKVSKMHSCSYSSSPFRSEHPVPGSLARAEFEFFEIRFARRP